ncbi:MAG TPA: hypothetical protein PLU67_04650 [Candidatus Kapabacteria bacterium]|nr:hypothetical protein [Candidatus Kapabacteria bacterium]HPP39628.1 hypothetical protein [Candidatus Kapabacteria bacterium]
MRVKTLIANANITCRGTIRGGSFLSLCRFKRDLMLTIKLSAGIPL